MDRTEFTIQGFKASAISAGIKKENTLDMALIYSEKDTVAAGVFTTNQVKAAPVLLCRDHVRNGKAKAIIINSGNANACTGQQGMENARLTASLVAKELGIKPEEVLVASTGVIGIPLDMNLFKKAIPKLVNGLSSTRITEAAQAILTTDAFDKTSKHRGEAGGKPYQILGIAKGAGMIEPNMATMLCFVLTNIQIEASNLQKALSSAVQPSFNRITVDGDMSTNDTVLVLANGMVGNKTLSKEEYGDFVRGLQKVMTDLAIMMVKDGEGATKIAFIKVKGAATKKDALSAAKTVGNSNLVKTAFYGQDPNWGRVMGALGRSNIRMAEEKISMWIDDVKIVEKGLGLGLEAEEKAAQKMKKQEFSLTIELNQGKHEDQVIASDLSHEYVTINADYRT